jgi:hypothetical protein
MRDYPEEPAAKTAGVTRAKTADFKKRATLS